MESNQDTGQVADTERGELIEGMVLDIIHRQNLTKVRDVVGNLQKLDRYVTTDEIHDAIMRLERRNEISLSEVSVEPSFFRNLMDFEPNAPFWIAIIATAAFLLTTFAFPEDDFWSAAKRIAGAVFLFFVPGYAMVNVLIARNRLSYIERMALSVGLSLAVVSVIGILLAYGVAGIRQEPIAASMSVFVAFVALLGAFRDFTRRHGARLSHQKFVGERKGSR